MQHTGISVVFNFFIGKKLDNGSHVWYNACEKQNHGKIIKGGCTNA